MLYANPGKISPFESTFGEGWYNTGDVVTVDADRFVSIRGRAKRFAKIAGEMISLEVVEGLAVKAAPAFAHTAVAIPDAAKGELIVLYTTDASLSQERLAQQAKDGGLPQLAVPRRVVTVPAIPLLGTGKTDYVTLNAMARG
jgi:acyl-[acyl-carrier-protein]-phospholipid O-acyltransferase/long-chain-fatty-acid--[acyl-carrier-protein] ligase